MGALDTPETIRRTITLTGPKGWTTQEVIDLCESFSTGSVAKTNFVPTWVLKAVRILLSRFEWSLDAADRLAFTNYAESSKITSIDCTEIYRLLDMNTNDLTTLEDY